MTPWSPNPPLEIESARALRRSLQISIAQSVRDFEVATGCQVTALELYREHPAAGPPAAPSICTSVRLRVEI